MAQHVEHPAGGCLLRRYSTTPSTESCLLQVQVLYAVALIPVGFLADKVDRPRLLSGGLATWSLLTMAASKVCIFLLSMLATLLHTNNPHTAAVQQWSDHLHGVT